MGKTVMQYKLGTYDGVKRSSSLKVTSGWAKAGEIASEKMMKAFGAIQENENEEQNATKSKKLAGKILCEVSLSFSPMVTHKWNVHRTFLEHKWRRAVLAHRVLEQ